jgi:hypothetical protein
MVLSDSGRSSPVSVSRNSARIALFARSIVTASLMEPLVVLPGGFHQRGRDQLGLVEGQGTLPGIGAAFAWGAMTATLILRARRWRDIPAPGTRRRK